MATTSSIGQRAETLARRYLEHRGLTLVQTNFRTRRGEIDLIMRDGECWVFVEVRYRAASGFGRAVDTIDRRKQSRIVACAEYFLQQQSGDAPARFDVICIDRCKGAIDIDWIRDAFGS